MAETAAVLDGDARPPAIEAARSLAASLRAGCRLEPLTLDGLPILDGEHPYAEFDMAGWRWLALDGVEYKQRALLVGGPLLMCTTGLAASAGNRRRRREAERAAAPRWRPLGRLRVVVTDRRLIVWHEGAWWSVWYDAIREARADQAGLCLDLVFDQDPPYRFEGRDAAVLTVVLAWLSARAANSFEIA